MINLRRCKERLASARERSGRSHDYHVTIERLMLILLIFVADSTASQVSVSREQSVEVIHLDVLRTFPTLGFFQDVRTPPLNVTYVMMTCLL